MKIDFELPYGVDVIDLSALNTSQVQTDKDDIADSLPNLLEQNIELPESLIETAKKVKRFSNKPR